MIRMGRGKRAVWHEHVRSLGTIRMPQGWSANTPADSPANRPLLLPQNRPIGLPQLQAAQCEPAHTALAQTGVAENWLRPWLTEAGSLTARLSAHCHEFRVQRLHQHRARCFADEAAVLGLPRARHVWEREVLLRCDGLPVVFAHTVVPLSCTATDWPLFRALGERSLGTTLFNDPAVERGRLHFARIRPSHPLYQRAQQALGGVALPAQLYARRSLFRRKQGVLLVTELFLPALAALAQPRMGHES